MTDGVLGRWLLPGSFRRTLLLGVVVYVATVVVFAILAGDRLLVHTPYNHYAQLANAWVHGRHDLGGPPPDYAGGNDFALYKGKWFISFPPFPALLMLPLVWAAGSAENFRDGQFVVWLAGVAPGALFLALEELRRTGRSERTEAEHLRLALLFAFATPYFFTAVQGTVWFAAHVVGCGLMALFLFVGLGARRPVLAGLLLGAMFATRPTTLLVGVFFVFEAVRAAYLAKGEEGVRAWPEGETVIARARKVLTDLDRRRLVETLAAFAMPVIGVLAVASLYNKVRFGNPSPAAFGHEYLTVVWQARIQRWGLFSLHFLPRNLSVFLTSLPWLPARGEPNAVPFVVSGHGLALWFTSPIYLWLVWPRRSGFVYVAAAVAAAGPCVMNLLYQNSGWFQYAYRFSNDYAPLLFLMLAVAGRRLGRAFWFAAAWSVAWNLFGALSFERPSYDAYYSHDASAYLPRD